MIKKNYTKKPKYGNHKVVVNGEKVADSKREYKRLLYLQALCKRGDIQGLQTQVKYVLIPSQKICGKTERGVSYIADFVYWTADDVLVVEDVKGYRTDVYILKRKLMKLIHNIDVVEV